MPTPTIYIRNKKAWLSQAYLLTTCNGLSDAYMRDKRYDYKKNVAPSFHTRDILPDTGKAWRWAYINDTYYYAYDNVPDKAPANYKSQLPTAKELLEAGNSPSKEVGEAAFETHFKSYLNTHYTTYLPAYNDCSIQQQLNLAKAASIMEAAIEYINTHNINISKYGFFNQLAEFVEKQEVKYFPSNPRVIKRKIESILKPCEGKDVSISPAVGGGGEALITLPRKNNANASKDFDNEEIRSWVLQLREMGQNFTNAYIIRKITDACTLTTLPCPSIRWIGKIMEERNTQYLTNQQRFGNSHRYAKVIKSYQPFKNALFAGDCWQIDGTRVNLVAHKHKFTKDGVTKTAPAFLDIIVVRDIHSGDILGWNFTLNEDRWSVISAIEMACKETGYLPYEMIFDKFPGHNTPEGIEFLNTLNKFGVTTTLSSDSKVKGGLERWFGTLQSVFMQESQYYYGEGIKSRRTYNHRSEAYIDRMKKVAWKEGFDWDTACHEATTILEAYKNTQYCKYSRKHGQVQQTPAELHSISDKPNTRTLEAEEINYLFGLRKEIDIDGKGLIKTEIQKATYYFRCTDTEVFGKFSKVLMIYSMEDLSRVSLYKISEGPVKQYLGMAYDVEPAQRYGPNADWGIISHRAAELRQMDDYRQQELEYKATGTYDITSLISPMSVSKRQANNNESNFMTKQVVTLNSTEGPNDFDQEDFSFNPRTQY